MMQNQSDPIIRVQGLCKSFGDMRAVNAVSLDVQRGEFFALVGPSGCGKTTLLRMLAGFEKPDAGGIFIDGRNMTNVAANKRPINMVFQSYAVFPHMDVAENVAYGLKIAGLARDEIMARTEEALTLVKLAGQQSKRPDQLSGGQRQRVALARALVMRPQVLLLDEPLSALDAKLREAMQLELVHLQKTVGITFLIVTHDQSEALSMADRIAVMQDGVVRQVASPKELYEAPNCRFVADFIGRINLFDGLASPAGKPGRLLISSRIFSDVELEGNARGAVTLAVRPEKIHVSHYPATQDGRINIRGNIMDISYFGGYSNMFIDIGTDRPLMTSITNFNRDGASSVAHGDLVWCSWRDTDTLLLTC